MSRDQPVWLLKLGKCVREREKRSGASEALPRAIEQALARLASSEPKPEEDEVRPKQRARA